MKFIKRGPKQEPTAVAGWPSAAPEVPVSPIPEAPHEMTEEDELLDDPTHDIELAPSSVAEAKLSIKELRLRKKALQSMKREATAEQTEMQAAWRERQAGRYSTIGLGRGTGGRIVRGMVQGKRRDERMQHADVVTQFVERKEEINDLISDVDQAILSLEKYILKQP